VQCLYQAEESKYTKESDTVKLILKYKVHRDPSTILPEA
jgi:hypothetical protein